MSEFTGISHEVRIWTHDVDVFDWTWVQASGKCRFNGISAPYTSTRASRRRKFPKNKWPIVRRKTCPDRVLPSTSGFFQRETKQSLHTSQSALHTSHFSLLPSHSKPHTSHFTLRSSHSKLKLHTPHFTLHIPHFTLLTSHCFLHTSHFTLLHSSRPTLHTALNLRATKKH